MIAADGTSIIAPIGMSSGTSMPFASTSSRAVFTSSRTRRNSSTLETIGTRIRRSPRVRGGEQGPQLRHEHLGAREAKADAAQAEDRVELLGADEVARALLAAEVVRPDHDGTGREPLDDLPVDGRLLLLGRELDALLREVQELGAEKPDAVGSVAHDVRDLARELDVRADSIGDSVGRERAAPIPPAP